jgi:polysaccharide biosynthesis protein PslG
MRPRPKTSALALALLIASIAGLTATSASPEQRTAPRGPATFFGIAPQGGISERDAEFMAAGGISTVRVFVSWATIKPSRRGGYNWTGLDDSVAIAARAGLRVLPFVWGTPHWVANRPTTMPVENARQRAAWTEFLSAAVERYGPRGEFWREHRTTGAGPDYEPPIPKLPIRSWQIWNEANFYYFAKPVSPTRYAKLVTISSKAIKAVDPGAKLILSGLFAKPTKGGSSGMPAAKFLEVLYRTPGIKRRFDGIALHPYAIDTETLEEFVEAFHDVTVENHDRVPLYITEMGWGSQNDFHTVAFEQGIQGQARELRNAYTYLLVNRNRLDVKQVYWFSWKDNREIPNCNFCDSVGLFRQGKRFRPKPAWTAFIDLTGGSPRP